MLYFRLVVPTELSARVLTELDEPSVTNVVCLPGAAQRPAGDLITCDITREAAAGLLARLRDLGLYEVGGVAVAEVEASPSRNASAAEEAAPGAPDDAVVWDEALDQAKADVRASWRYYVFLAIATTLAAIAVITDSSVLVIGAMVVGPEFVTISAISIGLVLRQMDLVWRAARLLVAGFAVAIVVTFVLCLIGRAAGIVSIQQVAGARPLTSFIWQPSIWSFIVAFLAGIIGVLSQTSGRGSALVGVFISVTTVPAAGDFALSVAVGAWHQTAGAAAQLGLNLVGMLISGTLTMLVERVVWRVMRRRRPSAGGTASGAALVP